MVEAVDRLFLESIGNLEAKGACGAGTLTIEDVGG